MKWRALLIALGIAAGITSQARGSGIEVPMQDAKASGQADAFTAQADNPSAIFYNPAGLTQLKGTNLSAGVYFLQPHMHFDGDNGDEQSMDLLTVLPHAYAETDFGTANWRFGIGVNNTFGINEKWGAGDRPLRFQVDEAKLMLLNISPTVAYKFNDNFSAGIAFNAYYGNLRLHRQVLLGAPPIPEGRFQVDGDDWAFGVTPGFLWKINERHSIGGYYRSPFMMDFGGKAAIDITGAPSIGPSNTNTELNFPQSAGLGYAFRPTPAWTIEADVIWTDWNTVDRLKIYSPDPTFNNQALPADWKSGFTYRLGTDYKINDNWAVRAGYAYSQNAVPDSTFSPIVPDSNYHLFALGVGYAQPNWGIDLSAQYIYRETHHVDGSVNSPTVDGEWENQMFGLMATFSLKL